MLPVVLLVGLNIRRALKELRARREIPLTAWLLSLAHWPMVYDLSSWSDPKPAFTRRMHRWLATAS